MHLFEFYETLIQKKKEDVRPFERPSAWPDAWKIVTSKRYERFPLIPCAQPTLDPISPGSLLQMRRSVRAFRGAVSWDALSAILYYGVGEVEIDGETTPLRTYPSAGRRYPLECYVMLMRSVGTVSPGVYHYDVGAHGLRDIRTPLPVPSEIVAATAEAVVGDAVGALLFTWQKERNVHKYKERAYAQMLIELGAAMENCLLIGTYCGVGMLPVGTCADDVVESLLDIGDTGEKFVQAVFFG